MTINPVKIETARLVLRQPDARDVDSLVRFYCSERSSMAGGHVAQAEAVLRAYAILGHWQHRGYGLFAIATKADENTAVGMAGPYYPPGRPETEIGWVLFDGAEGNGYATEAAAATIRFARQQLNWSNIVHYIAPENTQSIAVAKRLGSFLDDDAPQPKPDKPCLVFRQPDTQPPLESSPL